jgi:hypothetical protein
MATQTSTNIEFTNTLSSSKEILFFPTYNANLRSNKTFDIGLDLDSGTYEMDQASENIFKVWDLDIPYEEGELVKELKEVLSENSLRKDLKEGSLDDLIVALLICL